ncbi:hypothetical protein PRUPE_1G239500 [Prunus persica]|uniref:Methyltransferase type 11 domain-containing protein n=1 Tax=Prunus persica TaxID=3760 RepID=A0A251R2E9_PRUPE|nr:uncharacterized protein LOC18789239 [Prunus persica]ONI30239.1 hypothetical protein PRUPE_1G239500 [Prunus persica]
MKTSTQPKLLTFKYVFLSLLLTLPILLLVLRLQPQNLRWTAASPGNIRPPTVPNITTRGIRIRPGYTSYEAYIQRQVNKTLNPRLRQVWITRDWDRKIQVFSQFFQNLKRRSLLSNDSKSLCIGARVGQEVEALRRVGVSDSVGIDLVPYPPLVVKGDFHNQPFGNDTFDFEFSNVFDHALLPDKFVAEIERTLKPRGVCVLHVAVARRTDKYSANDLFSIKPLVEMFRRSELVQVREIDGFGANTEAVFMKRETGYGEHIQRS